jgi:hypothetical protein
METKMTLGQIIVPLRGSDRIEQFLPYIEQVTQPRMKVVFLVDCGTSRFRELTDQLLAIHTGIQPAFLPGQSEDRIVENATRSAQERAFSACQSLRQKGVTVDVNIYSGRLRRVLKDYLEKGDVYLVMMRPNLDRLMAYLGKIGSAFRSFKPASIPPVLLLHPSSIVGR